MWSSREGRDGYDLIEWLAEQEWCSGKIGMLGNSALAMAQWRIASEQPPHLACIAPWEGTADIYRETIPWGGFPENGFWPFLVQMLVGSGDCRRLRHHVRRVSADERLLGGQDPSVREDRGPGVRDGRVEPLPPSRRHHGLHAHQLQAEMAARRTGSSSGPISIRAWASKKRRCSSTASSRASATDSTGRRRCASTSWMPTISTTRLLRPEEDFPLPRTEYKKLYLDAANRSLSWCPVDAGVEVPLRRQQGQGDLRDHLRRGDRAHRAS